MENVFHVGIEDDAYGSSGQSWGSTDFEGPEGEYVVYFPICNDVARALS